MECVESYLHATGRWRLGTLKKREELNFAAKTKEVTFSTSAKTKWIRLIMLVAF